MSVLQRMRGEFLRTLPLLSLVKAQRGTLRAASAWFNEYRGSDGERERSREAAGGHPARPVRGSGELRREIRQQRTGDRMLPVPFRVRIYTITLSVYLNDPFRLQALTGTRTQRAVPLQGAQ